MDSDDQRRLSLLLTFIVTIKLFVVSMITLEAHNPPRSIVISSIVSAPVQPSYK